MATKISDDTQVAMPLRNILSIVAGVAIATWAYFGIIERLNSIETDLTLMSSDLEKNTEFRIKWPRGEMGALPADAEQFMLIEHLAGQIESIEKEIEASRYNKVNIDHLKEQVDNINKQIEKLRNGNH